MGEKTWHEDDEFWLTMAPFMFGEESWENAQEQVDQLISMLNLAPGSRVLDCPCGPGRHSLELARRGYQVTGVDRTAAYLDLARQRAVANGVAVEFVLEDMRQFDRPNTFDAVLSLFTSFGYFDDQAENQQVLLNYHRSLKGGGVLLLEMAGKEVIARIYQQRDWREVDGVYLLSDRAITEDWTRMGGRWILISDGAVHERHFSHWVYSAGELGAMLTESGFRQVAFYGSLAGDAYDHEAQRLVAVAQK